MSYFHVNLNDDKARMRLHTNITGGCLDMRRARFF